MAAQTKLENTAPSLFFILSKRMLIQRQKASIEVQFNSMMIYNIHSSTRSEIQLCQNAECAWIITILQTIRCSDSLIVLHQRLTLAFRNWYMIRRNDTNHKLRYTVVHI